MFKLFKTNGIDEIEIANFETNEKAYKKMQSLVKKEVKTLDYIKLVEKTRKSQIYEYGMYSRFYKIVEVKDEEEIK